MLGVPIVSPSIGDSGETGELNMIRWVNHIGQTVTWTRSRGVDSTGGSPEVVVPQCAPERVVLSLRFGAEGLSFDRRSD